MHLKTIDLFSGIGGIRLGFEKACHDLGATHECVFTSEIKKDPIEVYRRHFGNMPNPEFDITSVEGKEKESIPDFDMMLAGFPCFTASTPVVTDNGLKPISEVCLNDKLLTHSGEYRSILNRQIKSYTGDLMLVRAKYHPHFLECTPEHPFYVMRRTRGRPTRRNNLPFKNPDAFSDPSWVEARELDSECYIGMPINKKSITPSFIVDHRVNQNKLIEVKKVVDDPDQWYMMGYFLGDGWVEHTRKTDGRPMHKIRFSISDGDIDTVLPRLVKVLPLTDKLADSGKSKKYGCSDGVWHHILSTFGRYAHGKKIPKWVEDAPIEMIKAFMDGYFDADGTMGKHVGRSAASVSLDVMYGMQRLALKCGMIPSIQQNHKACCRKILGRMCNQRDSFAVRGFDQGLNGAFIKDGYAWFKVFKLGKRAAHKEKVYNFEVEIDNSYCVSNLAVHNCQAFSHVGKRLGFKDETRGTLFFNCASIIEAKQPAAFLLENVKGLVTHDKGRTFNTIKKTLISLGYHITYKVLNSRDYGVPHNRPRIYIVGFRDHEEGKGFRFPAPTDSSKRLADIIEAGPVDPKYFISQQYLDTLKRHRDRHQNKGSGFGYEVKSRHDVASCLVLGGMGLERNLVQDFSLAEPVAIKGRKTMTNSDRVRKLTPLECERLQGYEDGWTEGICDGSRWDALANSVSVPVIRAISASMIQEMMHPSGRLDDANPFLDEKEFQNGGSPEGNDEEKREVQEAPEGGETFGG